MCWLFRDADIKEIQATAYDNDNVFVRFTHNTAAWKVPKPGKFQLNIRIYDIHNVVETNRNPKIIIEEKTDYIYDKFFNSQFDMVKYHTKHLTVLIRKLYEYHDYPRDHQSHYIIAANHGRRPKRGKIPSGSIFQLDGFFD